jgi:hypothetical protein
LMATTYPTSHAPAVAAKQRQNAIHEAGDC